MADLVAYIPIHTTLLSLPFAMLVLQRYLEKLRAGEERRTHLLWWSIGIFLFGAGTLAEGFTTLFGWHEPVFRAWRRSALSPRLMTCSAVCARIVL